MEWTTTEPPDSLDAATEGGEVIRDEEHGYGARITLEKDAAIAPFALTCGVYGWMMHTRFFQNADDADRAFESMKADLHAILVSIPLNDDPQKDEKMHAVSEAIDSFVEKYPT